MKIQACTDAAVKKKEKESKESVEFFTGYEKTSGRKIDLELLDEKSHGHLVCFAILGPSCVGSQSGHSMVQGE